MLNFTWWVNRKDEDGRNIFQGGFLGLDNIGVFDRSAPLPTGGHIDQSDGTAWMAMYSLNLMRIALELAEDNHVYEDIATKFFEHFLYIAEAMDQPSARHGVGLWDEEDQFFYDVLHLPDGREVPLKVRSLVGLIPLFAVEVVDAAALRKLPDFATRLKWFLNYRPDLANLVSRWHEPGSGRAAPALPAPRPPHEAAAGADAGRDGIPVGRTACARSPRRTRRSPTSSSTRGIASASATCPASPTSACSAATRTGAARSGCR